MYVISVSDYYSIPRKDHVRIMKELIVNGPLQVSMHMYEDFRGYTKGIIYYIDFYVCIFFSILNTQTFNNHLTI